MCLEHMSRRDWLKLSALLTAGGATSLLSAFNARTTPRLDGFVESVSPAQITDPAHQACPFLDWRGRPGRERRLGGGNFRQGLFPGGCGQNRY